MLMNWSASLRSSWETCALPENPAYRDFASSRVVITSAPNGARRMPGKGISLPVTAGELAACAQSLLEQSVSVLHLHVRDDRMQHALDAGLYRAATDEIGRSVGTEMIVQITTESAGLFGRRQQMQVVRDVRPEAVSLALREICPDDTCLADAHAFFEWLAAERVWPQYILYSADDLQRFDRLRRDGVFVDDHPFALLVLGRYDDGLQGRPADLDSMLDTVDCSEFPWAVCCFGGEENAVALLADERGGHVRIGFENNVLLPDGSEARDNAALIEAFHRSRSASSRRPATAEEIRSNWLKH